MIEEYPRSQVLRRLRFTVVTVLLLSAMVALAELAARSNLAQQLLPTPVLATGSKNLGIKLEYLRRLVQRYGSVDCIFIGSSMVDRGIVPRVFEAAYQQRSGQSIRCFNLGAAGLSTTLATDLARIVSRRYRPGLLIFSALPATDRQGRTLERIYTEHPWVRYQNGMPSVAGWLMEHWTLLRYVLRLRIWLQQPRLSDKLLQTERSIAATGFTPFSGQVSDPEASKARLGRQLQDFAVAPRHLAALDELLLRPPVESILVLEMPVSRDYISLFPNGRQDFERMLAAAAGSAARHQAALWFTSDRGLIADDGWYNLNHMNADGAEAFSRWLGGRLADAVRDGELPHPAGRADVR